MSIITIGSVALNHYRDTPQKPRDIDMIATFDEAVNYAKVFAADESYPINKGKTLFVRSYKGIAEIEIAWPGSTGAELLEYIKEKYDTQIAPLDVLYALKMSHRYLRNSPHFLKTMRDIHEMRDMGASIPSDLQDWFKRREAETYDYGHPKLNQSKKDFFTGDGVDYKYDHDWLHEVVAVSREPMYRSYLKDGSPVAVDKNKWEALPYWSKLAAVYEEAAVLALERSIVPHPGVLTDEQAWKLALEKVCTSITSGWFREFAWENYHEICKFHDNSFTGASYFKYKFNIALRGPVRYHADT